VVGATVHTPNGPLPNAVVLFDKGRIVAVGEAGQVTIPAGAETIDAAGKHVYPGLFEASSALGLVEIDAVRATRDHTESGQINPNVRAETAVNPDSEAIPVSRSNGVLLCVTKPDGGRIAGRAAVLQLDGWTWEDMTLRSGVALQVRWPRINAARRNDDENTEEPSGRTSELQLLEETFETARAYWQAREADPQLPLDIRWESMIPVLKGEIPLLVAADDMRQIQSAVAFAARHKLRLIIYGGYDAPHCAALLKQHNVAVIVGGVHRLPRRRSDGYDTPFTVPLRLQQAGVPFCISGAGRFGAANVRNLPYHAATAAAYGLHPAEALKAITLYPAQILGVDDRVGALAAGKDATLFISNGDILETPTLVQRAWIQGRQVQLSDRHKRLWQKYQQKYRQAE
jgi:imidazolonepropionase-like amidohydrolase